ncbi:MAG: DUF1269 domain-containing protein [Solirubrobacterales bacterium]
MSDRPVFLYAAIYDDPGAAEADYEAVREAHREKLIGTYDAAVIVKSDDDKVHVTKTEKPTQHGAWGGIGVGAVVGILFPPALIASAAVGGVVGGVGAHLFKGMSRGDLKDLGEGLDEGQSAIIVIGESRIDEQIEKATKQAKKLIAKQIDADAEELKKAVNAEIDAAV